MKGSLPIAERLSLIVGSTALLMVPLVYRSGGFQFANYPKLFLLAALGAVAGIVALTRVFRGAQVSVPTPVILFVFICMLQWSRSLNPAEASIPLVALVGSVTLVFCVSSGLDARCRHAQIRVLAFSAGLVCVLGLLETWGVSWAQWRSAGRPSATLGFRNTAAMFAAGCLPWAFYLMMAEGRRIDRTGGALIASVVFLFVLYTRSRGAWLGVAVAGVACVAWLAKEGVLIRATLKRGAVGGAALAVLVYLGSLTPGFEDTTLSRLDEKKQTLQETVRSLSTPGGDRDRLSTWSHTLAMTSDHVLAGVGFGNWSAHYPAYDRGDVVHLQSAPRRPHNDYLWLASELGILGVGAYVWILMSALLSAAREREPWRLCAAASLMIIATHAFFSFPREQAATSLVLWFAIGLCLSGRETLSRQQSMGVWGTLALACLLGCGVMYRALAADTHYSEALRAQADGVVNRQLSEATQAVSVGTFDHRVLLVLADAQERSGNRDAALETYAMYQTRQPYLPAIQNNVGHLLNQVEQYAEAEEALRMGLEVLPGDRTLISNLSESMRRQGRVEEAITLYEAATTLGAQEHENLGVLYSELDSVALAHRHYEEAFALDPSREQLIYSRAGLDLIRGRVEAAVEGYETYLETSNPHPTLVRRTKARLRQAYPAWANQLQQSGRPGEALEILKRQVGLGDATAEDHHRLAIAYGSNRFFKRAEESALEALKRDPSLVLAKLTLANALYEQGNPRSLDYYTAFVEAWTGDPRLKEMAQRRLRERR